MENSDTICAVDLTLYNQTTLEEALYMKTAFALACLGIAGGNFGVGMSYLELGESTLGYLWLVGTGLWCILGILWAHNRIKHGP